MTKTRIKAIELKIYQLLRDYGCPLSRTDIATQLRVAPSTVGEALKRIDQECPNAFIEKVGRKFQIVREDHEFTNDEFYLLSQIVATSDLICVEQAKVLLEKIQLQNSFNKKEWCTNRKRPLLHIERMSLRPKSELQQVVNLNELIYSKKVAFFVCSGERYHIIPLKLVLAKGHIFLIAAPLANKKMPKIDENLLLLSFEVDKIRGDISSYSLDNISNWREKASTSVDVERKIKELEAKLIESI